MQDRPWYAHWPRGLAVSLEYPAVPVSKLLESSAALYPDRPALIFEVGQATTTYAVLWEKARKFAAALAGLGVKKGEVVAVYLPNSPQFAIAYYGALLAGAIFSPCDPFLSQKELLGQLVDSQATTLVALDQYMPSVMAVREATRLKRVIVTSLQEVLPTWAPADGKKYGPKTFGFQALLTEAKPGHPLPVVLSTDFAQLCYTGGTTGVPKGVALTHAAVVTNTIQFANWGTGGRPVLGENGLITIEDLPSPAAPAPAEEAWEFPVRPGEVTYMVVTPWSHSMGLVGYLNVPVYLGATMVVHPRFEPAGYMADLVKHRANVFGGAPQLHRVILNHPAIDSLDLSSVRWVRSGAAPLPVELLERMKARLPNAVIVEGYGLTEMTMGVSANPACRSGVRKPGSVGIPVFDTDVKIVDIDDPDIEIGFDELGEICVTGPQVMAGYWNRPQETANILRNGWIHTGDIGRMDEDGFVYVVDRKKDMLIYNGYNVYPRELEEILATHWKVARSAVIGKPDKAVGEFPKAFVVPKPGETPSAEELIEYVAAKVASYKRIREVEFLARIPTNYAGKALKRELREWEIERQAAKEQAAAATEGGGAPTESEAASTEGGGAPAPTGASSTEGGGAPTDGGGSGTNR